jgi:hypothetical protein
MAVGLPAKTTYADGDVFSASDINDTNGTINAYVSTGKAAGVNKIINGDFGVWARGTTFNNISSAYFADRFFVLRDGVGATINITQQTFTPGTAPQAGYEGKFFARIDQTVAGTLATFSSFSQRIEDVRTFAGQTMTLSFWAKASSSVSFYNVPGIQQNFGTGGSPSASVTTNASGTAPALTTSWQRFSYEFTVPSIAGKTIGTNNNDFLQINIRTVLNTAITIDVWGIQVEAGSIATAFQTASGSIQGELALCQRYYYRTSSSASNPYAAFTQFAPANSTTQAFIGMRLPVSMRIPPSVLEFANLQLADGSNLYTVTSASLDNNTTSRDIAAAGYNVASGLTQYRPYVARGDNSASAYIGFSAEL